MNIITLQQKRFCPERHDISFKVMTCLINMTSSTYQGPVTGQFGPSKGQNYQGSGSENPARPGFGTRPDAGPGSFCTIKFGKSPCPSEKNSCAARVPNLVQMVAGQSPVRPYQHFCTIRPVPLQGIGGDVSTRRTQSRECSMCVKEFARISSRACFREAPRCFAL